MPLVVFGLLLAGLTACANISTEPEELQRTWERAELRLQHGDTHLFGDLSSQRNQAELPRLAPAQKFPTVIYLHGCQGPDLEYQSLILERLVKEGFAVIAPNSFALSNRKPVCGLGSRHVFSVRAAEAQFAAQKAQALSWVDTRNLFLIGHSEGGAGAAAYAGSQFNAVVISGYECRDGIGARAPSLAVAYSRDEWLRNAGSICGAATERMILEGSGHFALQSSAVADRVVAFLKSHLRK